MSGTSSRHHALYHPTSLTQRRRVSVPRQTRQPGLQPRLEAFGQGSSAPVYRKLEMFQALVLTCHALPAYADNGQDCAHSRPSACGRCRSACTHDGRWHPLRCALEVVGVLLSAHAQADHVHHAGHIPSQRAAGAVDHVVQDSGALLCPARRRCPEAHDSRPARRAAKECARHAEREGPERLQQEAPERLPRAHRRGCQRLSCRRCNTEARSHMAGFTL